MFKKIKFATIAGKRILPDKDRKPIRTILNDLRWIKNKSSHKDKGMLYYFEGFMYKKDAGNIEHYLPLAAQSDFKRKTRHYQKEGKILIISDKNKFKELAIEKGIPTAYYLGKIKNEDLITSSGIYYKLKDKDNIKDFFSRG